MMADSSCLMCNKSPATDCQTCESAKYCSRPCQEADWSVHKLLCKKFANLSPRPGILYKLGILLSADCPEPRPIWVLCPHVGPEDFSTRHSDPAINIWLGFPRPHTYEPFVFSKNEVRGYDLKQKVVLYARDNWLNDMSKPNQAALALTDWKLPYDWRGNLLIMSYNLMERPRKPVENFPDVTLEDLRAAIDYLSLYGVAAKQGKERSVIASIRRIRAPAHRLVVTFKKQKLGKTKEKVRGVLIRCEADVELYKQETGRVEQFSATEVSRTHAIWNTSPIESSRVMGLPLLIYTLPNNWIWYRNDPKGLDNPPVTSLNLSVDPASANSWGTVAPYWQSNVGSVVIVRKDGRDLTPEQALAVAEFMKSRIAPAFRKAASTKDISHRRNVVLKMLNWSQFDMFLENFKVEMATTSDRWMRVPSPFGT